MPNDNKKNTTKCNNIPKRVGALLASTVGYPMPEKIAFVNEYVTGNETMRKRIALIKENNNSFFVDKRC